MKLIIILSLFFLQSYCAAQGANENAITDTVYVGLNREVKDFSQLEDQPVTD